MARTQVQQSARIRQAELLGYRLAEEAQSEEIFDNAVNSDSPERMEYAEAMYRDLGHLDPKNKGAVWNFLAAHFREDVCGLDKMQREECVRVFADQIS